MKRTWYDYDTPLWAVIVGWVIAIIIALGILFGVLCLEGWLGMLLWNATLPVVFSGVSAISFWQSVGINLLITLLFGGVGRTIAAFAKKD
jgi:hypothetical protein